MKRNHTHTIEQVHTFLSQCGVSIKWVEGQRKGGYTVRLDNREQVIRAVSSIRQAGGNVIYFSQGLTRNHYVRFYLPATEEANQ